MRSILLLTTALAFVPTAFAQDSETADDVIVVTAQKRAQDIRDVPLAISAFDQEAMDAVGIQQFDDLADFVPGLEVQEQSANNPGFVIRGITSDSGEATIEPRVSVFQDGVPISRSRGSFVELFDSQVEVVRGPQPTLFGRSALIGAINVVSNKPELDVLEGKVRIGAGNEEYYFGEGMINAPITDTLAVRVAGRYKSRDGYVDNLIGDDLNGFETAAVRGSVLFAPIDSLEAQLIVGYQKDDNPGTSFKSGTFLPADPNGLPAASASLNPFKAAALSTFGGINGGQELGLERELTSITALVDYDINDIFTLSSVTNYREFDSKEVFDPDGFGLPLFAFAENAESEQLFQEIRLGFENLGRFSGFVGASVFDEEGSQNVPLYYDERVAQALLGGFLFSGLPGTEQVAPPLALLPAVNANPTSPLAGAPLGIFAEEFTNFGETTSYDVFADATFAVTDRFELTAGVRYTYDEKKSGYTAGVVGGAVPVPALTTPTQPGNASALTGAGIFLGGAVFAQNQPLFVEDDYDGLTYRVAAQYDVSDDITVFANYGHGRRPEVLSYALNTTDIGLNPSRFVEVDAEETDAFEIGARGDFLGGALSTDVVAYYYEYTNFQTSIQTETGIIPANAGNASGPGFEGSAILQGAPWARYFATYAYNGVEFDDTDDNGVPQTRAGNTFRLAPVHSFAAGAEFTFDAAYGAFSFTPVYTYKSEVFFDDDNDTTDLFQDEVEGGYGLVDLRLTYVPNFDDTLKAEIFVENAFDEEYLLDAGNTGDAFGIPTFIAGVPQMYGIYLSKSF